MALSRRDARAHETMGTKLAAQENRGPDAMDRLRSTAMEPNGEGESEPPCTYSCLLSGTPDSAAMLPTCTDKCDACFASYRSENVQRIPGHHYDSALTDAEAHGNARRTVESITANIEYVRTTLQMYGDAVLRRWTKRTKDKRAAMLSQAMPKLSGDRFASVSLLRNTLLEEALSDLGLSRNPKASTIELLLEQRVAFLLNWLDVPTLCDSPSYLFSLLHHRSHSSPSDWARFDGDEIAPFFRQHVFKVAYNPHCVTIAGSAFGSLVQWTKGAAHRREIVGYPLGQLILEAQSALSQFLRAMVDLIVPPTDKQTPRGSERWYEMSTVSFQDPKGGKLLQSDYLMLGFGEPPRFSIDRLLELVSCRFDAAKDDLWQVQASPNAVRDMLQDVQSTDHHGVLPGMEKQQQLVSVLAAYIRTGNNWKFVLGLVRHLKAMQQQYGTKIRPGRDLPALYEEMLKLIEYLLRNHFATQVEYLQTLISLVPDFQHYFRFVKEKEFKARSRKFCSLLTTPHDLWLSDPMFFALTNLIASGNDDTMVSPQAFFRIMNHLTSLASKKGNSRLPDFLWRHLSDMATCHEILTMIWHHRPARGTQDWSFNQEAMRSEELIILSNKWKAGFMVFEELGNSYRVLAPALCAFLSLSSPEAKRCADPIAKLRACYSGLQVFWQKARDALSNFVDRTENLSTMRTDLLNPISAHKSLEYLAEIEADCSMLQQKLDAQGKLPRSSLH